MEVAGQNSRRLHGGSISTRLSRDISQTPYELAFAYADRIGVVVEINDDDVYGAILVRFSEGLQFRYTRSELLFLALLPSHLSRSSGRVA